jgi:hypothetical protein
MDVTLLVLQYSGLYYVQVILKSPFYSIKLKLEFAILGKLVLISTSHSSSHELTDQTTPTQHELIDQTTQSAEQSRQALH